MRIVLNVCFLLTFLTACTPSTDSQPTQTAAPAVGRSDTYFEATGDVEVKVEDARAELSKNQIGIVVLTVGTTAKSYRKLGKNYGARLFFSKKFDPKPGKYPVEFAYLDKTDTLGGSFAVGSDLFSHDTKGVAEFLEFGDQVKVRFEFQTAETSGGSEQRRVVTVRGEAVCPRGDAI